MIAHLGMYDVPLANAAFWLLIRRSLGYGPDQLTQTNDFWSVWQSPDLLFSQTCSYPYRARLHGQVQLIGTPDYGLPGCPPGYYCSVFIRRKDGPRKSLAAFEGARFAYNEALSQSGWAAPVQHMIDAGLRPCALVETGGHAKSFLAVLEGRADFAALDALTWQLICESDMDITDGVIDFERTAPTPTLPYITGTAQNADQVRTAVRQAITNLPDAPCRELHLQGLVDIPAETYLSVSTPPGPDEFLT